MCAVTPLADARRRTPRLRFRELRARARHRHRRIDRYKILQSHLLTFDNLISPPTIYGCSVLVEPLVSTCACRAPRLHMCLSSPSSPHVLVEPLVSTCACLHMCLSSPSSPHVLVEPL
eukprot:1178452-Prorocentrum_minimum.AAC.3